MGSSFTAVSGSWIVPAATGNGSADSADSTWVGVGGVNTSDLIQAGTENTVHANGQVETYAFFEMLPAPAMLITSMTVKAGDSVSAAVTEITKGTWRISVRDNTTQQTYTTTVSYTSSYASAEWIEEDPSYLNGALVPLDNFGSATFSNGSTTARTLILSIASSGAQPITLTDSGGKAIITPSVLINSGSGFLVTQSSGSQ